MKNTKSTALTAEQRRALRAKAHPLHPVVLIGDKGLSEAVLQEIDSGLRSHELIKIRAQGEREQREVWLNEICERLSAQPVQHIGKVLVIYREWPPDPAAAPVVRAPRAKPASGLSKRAADRARARSSGARAPATTRARPRARTR